MTAIEKMETPRRRSSIQPVKSGPVVLPKPSSLAWYESHLVRLAVKGLIGLCIVGLLTTMLKIIIDHEITVDGDFPSTCSYPNASLTLPVPRSDSSILSNDASPSSLNAQAQFVRTAVDFCSQHGERFGFTLRTAGDCVDQIMEALNTLEEAGGDISSWAFKFKRHRSGPIGSRDKFVLEAHQLIIQEPNYQEEKALQPITKLPSGMKDLYKIHLNINDAKYVFEFNKIETQTVDSVSKATNRIDRLAIEFCRLKGVELGAISETAANALQRLDRVPFNHPLNINCVIPLREALLMKLHGHLEIEV